MTDQQTTFGDFAVDETEQDAEAIQSYRRAQIAADVEAHLHLSYARTREDIVDMCDYDGSEVLAALWYMKDMGRVEEVDGGKWQGVVRRHHKYDD